MLIVLRLKASSPSLMSQDHRQSHGNNREPLLENITSDYDLELFRKAQARASEDLVRERELIALPPIFLFLFLSLY